MNTKLTILYERLSREDERETESISIENQKAFLEDFGNAKTLSNVFSAIQDKIILSHFPKQSQI